MITLSVNKNPTNQGKPFKIIDEQWNMELYFTVAEMQHIQTMIAEGLVFLATNQDSLTWNVETGQKI